MENTVSFFSPDEDKAMDETNTSPHPGSTLWKKQQYDKRTAGDKRKREDTEAEVEGDTMDEPKAEEEKKKGFRVSAKSFWLTWSGLYRGELDHGRILSLLLTKGALAEYSIGCEHHKPEKVADADKDDHFHAFAAYETKLNIKSEKSFDLRSDGTYGGRVLHPLIDTNKTKQDRINRINYTMKEDPNPLQKLNGPLGTAMSKAETYHALNDRTQVASVNEGMELLRTHAPEEYFKFGDAVERRLTKIFGGAVEKEYDLSM